ncbi:MAG: hypothetical protein OEZ43_21020 [Gammaproteobacteria bacterium]|nr:hypothetical protein [Gammaproteobacteria bacterium]
MATPTTLQFSAAFTVVSDTPITSYTPETGLNFTACTGNPGVDATVDLSTLTLYQKWFAAGGYNGFFANINGTWSNDQKVEIYGVVGSSIYHQATARLNANGTSGKPQGYTVYFNTGTNKITIARFDDGVPTVVAEKLDASVVDADKIELEVIGTGASNLTVYKNSVSSFTGSDSTYATGKPGVITQRTGTVGYFDNYKAYDDASVGGVSIAPAAAIVSAVCLAPTVIQGSLIISPELAQSLATAIAPTVIQGSLIISPELAQSLATAIAPTVIQGSMTISPTFAAAIVTAWDPVATVVELLSTALVTIKSNLANAIVSAELSNTDKDNGLVSPSEKSLQLDASGVGSIELWPNIKGTEQSRYIFTFKDAVTGATLLVLDASLPVGAVNLWDVATIVSDRMH